MAFVMPSNFFPVFLFGLLCFRGSGEVYLVPILPYGPNNQIQSLREVTALAAALNYSVVAHGLLPHPSETDINRTHRLVPPDAWKVDPAGKTLLPLDLVFDRKSVEGVARILPHEQAVRDLGWDGRLELVLVFHDVPFVERDVMQLYNEGLVDALDAEYLTVSKWKCSNADLGRLKERLSGRTYVGVITFAGALTNGLFNKDLEHAKSWTACSRALLQIILHLRMSEATVATARDFIDRHVPTAEQHPPTAAGAAGLTSPFIALHIRPWPDSCLDYWIEHDTPLDPAALNVECIDKFQKVGNPNLIDDIAYELLAAASSPPFDQLTHQHRTRIFIMCHPRIRHKVVMEMHRHLAIVAAGLTLDQAKQPWWRAWWSLGKRKRSDLTPAARAAAAPLMELFTVQEDGEEQRKVFFLETDDLPIAFRNRKQGMSTVLGLVEQQVCRDAHTFIGTDLSSMTRNIMQEREALQKQDVSGARAGFRMTRVMRRLA